jgi:hypothetical protein
MAIAPEPKITYNPLTGLTYNPNAGVTPKPATGLQPTVTIGGAPAGYKPTTTMQPTVTIGGAPAGYTSTTTPNYITGAGVPGVDTTSVAAKTGTTGTAGAGTGTGTGTGTGAPKGQPGSAWIWDGTKWAKPAMPQDGNTYTWDDNKGWVASAINTATSTTSRVDSIAAIKALLSSYGIGDLGDAITNAVMKGYSSDTIQLIMQDPNSNDPLAVAFQTRFPANKARLAAGKSVLSPAEYLRAERSYTEVLQSYGVSSLATRDKLNQFIANDVSAAEVSDRVGLAVNRVQNADADTKKALAEYYPMLNQADIVNAVLDPKEGLPALQRKIQIGEIGGAALAQGIKTSQGKTNILMGAETLANLGVTKEQARAGFQTVAEVTPRADFLSQISTGEDYGQLQAEQEAFQGLASAKRARTALTEQEKARFGGSAGVNRASLTSQTRGTF